MKVYKAFDNCRLVAIIVISCLQTRKKWRYIRQTSKRRCLHAHKFPSKTDIEHFEQIALLRKADFSLEQIKTLKSGGESAKEVLIAYLATKKESVVTGQKIVDALKDIPQQEIVTIDYVCEKIKEFIVSDA